MCVVDRLLEVIIQVRKSQDDPLHALVDALPNPSRLSARGRLGVVVDHDAGLAGDHGGGVAGQVPELMIARLLMRDQADSPRLPCLNGRWLGDR